MAMKTESVGTGFPVFLLFTHPSDLILNLVHAQLFCLFYTVLNTVTLITYKLRRNLFSILLKFSCTCITL